MHFCYVWWKTHFLIFFKLYYFQLQGRNDCFSLLGLIKQFGSLMGLVRVETSSFQALFFSISGLVPAESSAWKPEVNFPPAK